ncbi:MULTISPECIES: phage tail tip fiber protein [unclassified Pseudomonas]|uniref:phage tail tip fiber protein n=1 Tax=unclassified Pseudomonas TaxID=196821 RepID=UPI001B32C789|nr:MULTISPECIES: DUF1983 domain-containing protein [unclassified Pseudomonas]MBP5948541.1 DUF1983 domain-containing protein [Pseudomonas sp. P9(2020)]MBZ9560731.1 DUF1983 domain-containing protein [Pseudomonas sp. P116]
MQSANYVPGVSGWKIDKSGRFVLNDGNQRIIATSPMIITAGPGQTNDQANDSIRASITSETEARCKVDEAVATHIGAMECSLSKPFVVVDGVMYIRQASIKEADLQAKIGDNWSVKMELRKGKYVAAGIGLGIASQSQVDADKCRIHCMCGGGPAGFEQT